MSQYEFDAEDAALTVASFIAVTAMVGIAQWSLFDVSLADAAFSAANYDFLASDVTIAYILSVGSFAGTVLTNDNAEWRELVSQDTYSSFDNGTYYWGAVVGVVAIMVGWLLIGDVASFFQSSDLWGLLLTAATLVAQATVGWML
jgi:hypothetical protein